MTLKVAIVGLGYMGTYHAATIHSQIPEARVVAAVDPDSDRLSDRAKVLKGCVPFKTVEELLDHGVEYDCVVIASPNATHYETASTFLNAGKHCLVEKPLASTADQARRLVALARSNDVVLLPGHIERFNPAVIAVRERLRQPRYISAFRVGPMSFRSIDTDVVLDVMLHDLDLARHFCGVSASSENAEVEVARAVTAPAGLNDIANVHLNIAGCIVDLTASRLGVARRRKMRIFTEDGYFSIDTEKPRAMALNRERYFQKGLKGMKVYQDLQAPMHPSLMFSVLGGESLSVSERDNASPLEREIRYFFELVENPASLTRDALLGPEDGVEVLVLAEKILDRLDADGTLPIPDWRADL